MDVLTLRSLENRIRTDIADFKVRFKDESWLLKAMGVLSYPFNPRFMTNVTTTLGSTVYFPTRAYYEQNVERSFDILTHEYVHMWDRKTGAHSEVLYLFPQLLAVVPLLLYWVFAWPHLWIPLALLVGYVPAALVARKSFWGFTTLLGLVVAGTGVLSAFLVGWGSFALLGVALTLIPWPAPWRAKTELRGYSMTIAVRVWQGGRFTNEWRDALALNFYGPGYYYMMWSKSRAVADLDEVAALAATGALQRRSPPHAAIHDFLYQQGLLHS